MYATTISDGDRQLIHVLECSLRGNSYDTYLGTVEIYAERPDDDIIMLSSGELNIQQISKSMQYCLSQKSIRLLHLKKHE
jgi:hypothetical protein